MSHGALVLGGHVLGAPFMNNGRMAACGVARSRAVPALAAPCSHGLCCLFPNPGQAWWEIDGPVRMRALFSLVHLGLQERPDTCPVFLLCQEEPLH